MKILFTLFLVFYSVNTFAQLHGELRYNSEKEHYEIFINLSVYDSVGTAQLREMGKNYSSYKKLNDWFDFDSLYRATPNGMLEHREGFYDLNQVLVIKSWYKSFRKEEYEKQNPR
ncbi:MAG: hypothetical protein PVF17_04625 [Ignavibacteria bacterium]|jgi:hypothetical protein